MIRVTAFQWVPPFAQGLVCDLRVRWALEEASLPYEEKLLALNEHKLPAHLELQPFGQVPVYEENGLSLFESGAIDMHIGERSPVLLPTHRVKRARAQAWMFAALNSVEPHVHNYASLDVFHAGEEWARLRKPGAREVLRGRLDAIAASLQGRDYLEHEFSAGDLLMISVLRILRDTDLVKNNPVLAAYQARGEARPAFQRALAAQLAPFELYAPAA